MVIILKALDKERIDEVINVSKEMNRGASKSDRLLIVPHQSLLRRSQVAPHT